MGNIEKIKKALKDAAEVCGYKILHLYAFDLQDGTHNVKAIIETPDGITFTDGRRVTD